MSPTGPKYPATASSGAGVNGVWTNPTNVFAIDAVYASGDITGGGSNTNNLLTSNYGFAIPATGVIDGILMEFVRHGINAATLQVQIIKGGSLAGTAKPGTDFWPTSDAITSYGGATDLWGTTWAPSDINNSNFGVALSAVNTHGGGTALVDVVRLTVYWHTTPTDVPKRYDYKVFDSNNVYLGNLPNVTSQFGFSQDINTAGAQITVECAVSPDTSLLPTNVLTDESGNILTDESSVTLTDEGTPPIMSPGSFTTGAIIKNGNLVQVWEYGFYNPNGKCLFRGEIERWEASFGAGGGSGGAAMGDTSSDTITLLIYSDGQDLDNYLVRGNPYTYTADVSQTSQNTSVVVSANAIGAGHDFFGQTWKVGAGVTNLGAISLLLNGSANVTVTAYDTPALSHIYGVSTQFVNVVGATEIQFAFSSLITTIPASTLFYSVTVDAGQSITLYASTANPYANGAMYEALYSGSGGGSYITTSVSGYDMYFKTFSGTGSTTGTFTSQDPTTGMLAPIMSDYISRGGVITYTSSTIQATGLSLTATFNTRTAYDAIQAILTLAPNGFYFYVDLGTDVLYFKQASTTADIVLTKDHHFDQITIIATIENVINQSFFTGGPVSGVNIYTSSSDPTSISLYGPRLDRTSDNGIIDLPTAQTIPASDVAEKKSEQYQTTVTVVDKTMDTTTLKPGLTVGLNGFGTFADSLIAQIVRVDYTPEEATLTLGVLPPRQSTALDQITRQLLAQQTLANPSTPS